ncbi:hypothetical protein NDU88_006833 [Pleurodeles waltl]|uniref:ribonuclease H n=1 Tax=Pleurodeles waltl TaxID=8319 RepID=A0AAV7MF22_PLEWA|nr:hypothetical protein NDU88_006833 [Pleurodeles waltl]
MPFCPVEGARSTSMVSPQGMASPPTSVAPLPSPHQPTPMLSPGQPAPLPACQPTPKEVPLESVSAPGPSDVRIHASSVPGRDSASMESMSRLESRLRCRREALRLLEEEEYRQLEEGELKEPLEEFQGLGSASGLDTFPEWDISFPGEFTEEAASFHSVIRKAADYLDLPLSAAEVKTNLLTEVLHPSTSSADPLLPFHEALLEPIMDLWRKPVSAPAEGRSSEANPRPEDFELVPQAGEIQNADSGTDWMVSVDLQDVYFHIPILKSNRKYLRFVVGSQHYQFAVLPFGLTSAPRVFTKVMVVAAHLRRKGIAVFPYLDDWLIKAKSPELVLHHLQVTTH